MSYKELAAKDAIVGVYPVLSGVEKPLTTVAAEPHPALPANLDVRNLKLSVEDGTLLKVTFETRGPVLLEGDPAIEGITYRVLFDAHQPSSAGADSSQPTLVWTALGFLPHHRPSMYIAFGPGVSRKVKASGNTITLEGVLPAALRAGEQVTVSAEVAAHGNAEPVERLSPHAVRLSGILNPEVHLSSLTRKDGPFAAVYESFHYLVL